MRIISGNFKNKKLNFPKSLKTRPLKDNVKENIFNIIEHSNKIDVKINVQFKGNRRHTQIIKKHGTNGFACLMYVLINFDLILRHKFERFWTVAPPNFKCRLYKTSQVTRHSGEPFNYLNAHV